LGLDWIPAAGPLPGKEVEFNKILDAVLTSTEDTIDELHDQLDLVSRFTPEAVKAPRVGFDEIANKFMEERYQNEQPEEPFNEWVKQFHGRGIISLADQCDGIPRYSNGGYYDGVDSTSFRGGFLNECLDIIGKKLLDQAFETMRAEQLLRYADQLEERANSSARIRKIDLNRIDWSQAETSEYIQQLDIVLCAARYCRFWGQQGFYVRAWF